jgi:hypothetical protein
VENVTPAPGGGFAPGGYVNPNMMNAPKYNLIRVDRKNGHKGAKVQSKTV